MICFSPPRAPDFWKPQSTGGVVGFFPVQQKCDCLRNFWGVEHLELRAAFPSLQHLSGPCKSSGFPDPKLADYCTDSSHSSNNESYAVYNAVCQEPC